MAKVYKRADGSLGFRVSQPEEADKPLPGDVVDSVVFDEDTNAVTVRDLMSTLAPFTIVAGVLKKNGVTVSFVADGDKAGMVKAAAAAIQANSDFLAIASPTNAQTLAQVKALTQQNTRIIKRLVQLSQ